MTMKSFAYSYLPSRLSMPKGAVVVLTIRRNDHKKQHSNKASEIGQHVFHQSLQRGPGVLFRLLSRRPHQQR